MQLLLATFLLCLSSVLAAKPCTTDCAGSNVGRYPDCSSCNNYHECSNSVLLSTISCGSGQNYDVFDEICKSASDAICGNMLTAGGGCINDCSETSDSQQFAKCGNCEDYLICILGAELADLSCNSGLVFNTLISSCSTPTGAACGVRQLRTSPVTSPVTSPSTSPATSPSTSPATSPSTSPVTSPSTSPITSPVGIEVTICTTDCSNIDGSGLFPLCGSCTNYVLCFPGFMVTLICGPGLIFDIRVMGCASAAGGVCGVSGPTSPITSPATSPITSPVTSPVTSPITSPGTSPITSPVTSPITSPVTSPVTSPLTSPVTSPLTSPTTILITSATVEVPCFEDSCAGLGTGIFPSCTDCSLSVLCINDNLDSLRPCPSGLLFDVVGNTCRFPVDTTCATKPLTSPVTSPTTSPATSPLTSPITSPVSSPITSPVTSPVTSPITSPVTSPVTSPITSAATSPVTSPNTSPSTSPATSPITSPVTSPVTSPITSPVTSPVTSPITSPVTSPITSPITSPVTSPVTSPITSPVTSPVTSPITSPVTSPVTSPITSPVTSPVTSPSTSPVTSPVTSPITSPVTSPVTSPMTSPVTSPVTSPITSPVTSPVTSPITSPVTSPVTSPITSPVTSPVTSLITSPVTSPVTSPMTSPVTSPATSPIPFECTFSCADISEPGLYPHCSDCSRYFICGVNTLLHSVQCSAGLLYDIITSTCNFANTVTCFTTEVTPSNTEVTECSNNCAGIVAPGLYPVCGDCASYDVCLNSAVLNAVTCSPDLLFDIVTQTCNFPESTTCGVAGPTSTVTSPATSPTNVVAVTPNQTEVVACSRDCSTQTVTAFYPVCGDCSKYHICAGGAIVQEVQCFNGLLFDIVTRTCNFPEVTTCGVEALQRVDSSVSVACVDDCSGKADGDYQSCNGCDMYASCTNGNMIDERPCPLANTLWDDTLKECVHQSSTCVVP